MTQVANMNYNAFVSNANGLSKNHNELQRIRRAIDADKRSYAFYSALPDNDSLIKRIDIVADIKKKQLLQTQLSDEIKYQRDNLLVAITNCLQNIKSKLSHPNEQVVCDSVYDDMNLLCYFATNINALDKFIPIKECIKNDELTVGLIGNINQKLNALRQDIKDRIPVDCFYTFKECVC
jgi:hypothetical protein